MILLAPLLFMWFSCSTAQREGKRLMAGRCEMLHGNICSNMGYNRTYVLENRDRGSSKVELYGYASLLRDLCPNYFLRFACGVYFPKCSEDSTAPLFPCKSRCEEAKSECETIMHSMGLKWPKKFNCRRFRKRTNCLGDDDRHRENSTPPVRTTPNLAYSCEAITTSICQEIGYNFTHFPSSRFQRQSDAALEVNQFYPLVQLKCSPHLQEYLCSVYIPECTVTQQEVQTCRSLCEAARDGCISIMTRFGFAWPHDCNNHPISNCRGLNGAQVLMEVELEAQDATCQRLVVPSCLEFGYEMTHLPNSRTSQTQQYVAANITNFFALVQDDCHERFQEFICAILLPECTETRTEFYPCRSVCEAIKEACYPGLRQREVSWPEGLECDSLPTKDCKDFVGDRQIENAPVCEPLVIGICGTLGYNSSWFPNSRVETQDEAAELIFSYSPLVKVGCSNSLLEFLCSAYAPQCTRTQQIVVTEPCRSLCEASRNGCADIMSKFGFAWPDKLDCDNFPNCETFQVNTDPDETDTLDVARSHLVAVKESIRLFEANIEQLLDNGNDSCSRPLAKVLEGLQHLVSGLRSNLIAISTLLEVFEV